MSDYKTVVVGMPSELKNFPLEAILTQFGVFRDAIAGTAHYEVEELPEFIAN
jgi:hypothetical protein